MVQLTEEEVKEVISKTGATREDVMQVAAVMPELGQWLRWGILKTWSCGRALTCLGPLRKVYWAIICLKTTVPI